MSFLPYASAGIGSWFTASGGAALLHGTVLAASLSGVAEWLNLTEPKQVAQPDYTITLERLDSDTIAGLLEQDGQAATEDGDGVDPEALDPAEEVEEQAALPPEEVATPEDPAEAEPEEEVATTPEEQEAEPVEALTAATPTPLAPESIEPITPQAIEPLVEDDGPLLSETVAALPSAEALTPIVPDSTAVVASPAPSEPQVMRPVTSSSTVVSAVQRPEIDQKPRKAAPAPSAQDLAIGDLLRRIRATPSEPCLLALPRRDGEDGVGLALVSNSEATMARFADALLTAEDAGIRQTRSLIDERQCAAMTYIRDNADYPATRLGVRLDAAEVPSGGRLTGVLRGTAGRYVLLLLVDNNGVVQDLQRFMTFSGNFARFDVPVTRAGAPRDTKQLLLAIATRRPTQTVRARAGQLAQDVFAGLEGEVATRAALAVTTFDVR